MASVNFDEYLNSGKRTDLKIGEVSYIVITISELFPLEGFRLIYCATVKTIYLGNHENGRYSEANPRVVN